MPKYAYSSGVLFVSALLALVLAGCWISDNRGEPTEEAAPAVRVGAVASADEDVQSSRVEHSNETTPADEAAPPSGVEHTGAATPADEATSPSSMGEAHGGIRSNKGRIPAPLRLRIYEATTIVRATLISSSAMTERYWDATGFDVEKDKESIEDWYPVDGGYRAVHSFQFRVTEYLKGSSVSKTVVRAMQLGTHETEEQALQVATDSLASRDTTRDTHEAILFLWEPTTDGDLYFLISGAYPSLHYTIDTLNRVWLPAKNPPATEEESSSSDDSSLLFLVGEPVVPGSPTPDPGSTTMSLGELRSEIVAVDALLEAGDGADEYRECVAEGWRYEQTYSEARTPLESLYELASGTAEETVVESASYYGLGYNRRIIEGMDRELFKSVRQDTDEIPKNGYKISEVTARPLPMGSYQYSKYTQRYAFIPCDFIPYNSYRISNVIVTAPAGILHELFFDPVTIVADATNGVLKPASFTDASGGSVTIHSISYEAGTVKVEVTPDDALAGHIVDFIELDGTVSLSLDVADATVDPSTGSGQAGTLSWSVSSQPWEDGDMLMVRIREAR